MWVGRWRLPQERLSSQTAVVNASYDEKKVSTEYVADKCNYIYPNGWHSLYHRKVTIMERYNFTLDEGRSMFASLLQVLFVTALYMLCSGTVTTAVVIIYVMLLNFKESIVWSDFFP